MTTTTSTIISEQEYLLMEEKSPVRHEFINGKLYEMPGGSMLHEQIISNIHFLLKSLGLTVFIQGLRVRPPQSQNYYYPDILVTSEKVTKAFYAQAPTLLAEVLSPSTRANDLTDKFLAYRQFPSLYYYILAEPDFCQITLFYKTESGEWESELYRQPSDVIQLEKLNASLPLSGVYDGIDWSEDI
jgi:Uma2 family endonuclease